ncbi:hypothetical protein DFLDMN_001531 [Cupriavidus sp. H19C3]|uniref:hypothetical protein n=1 Tax=Cupriavidus sp. H19C3 TaxID=3241603 RepID=UPI003BF917A2
MGRANVRHRVIRALADGEEIVAADYARKIRERQSAVSNVLGGLGSSVVKVRKGVTVVYRAADVAKMREKLSDLEYTMAGLSTSPFTFDGLLAAWNIAPRVLDLPSHVHRMAVKEDKELLFG